MKSLIITLRILSLAFIAVAMLHFVLGLQADVMLGAQVPAAVISDPSLDSQNRFYGISFSPLGIVLLIGTTDLRRYRPMIIATFGVLFAAGVARVWSWGIHGAPSAAIIGIICADLLLPPVLTLWVIRFLR